MKRLFPIHVYLGNLANISDDSFQDHKETEVNVRPSMFRWFCGMHDMESTYICQMM